jgi:diacylglycerol O-acyltransferase / wax synthase
MTEPIKFNPFMSGTDALMHAFETDPSLRTSGVGLFLLASPPDRGELTERVELLTRTVPRFRQKVVEIPLGVSAPRYVVDPRLRP